MHIHRRALLPIMCVQEQWMSIHLLIVCLCVRVRTRVIVCLYIYVVVLCVYTYTCVYFYGYVHTHAYCMLCVCGSVWMCLCMCMCMCTCMHMCMYMRTCMCIPARVCLLQIFCWKISNFIGCQQTSKPLFHWKIYTKSHARQFGTKRSWPLYMLSEARKLISFWVFADFGLRLQNNSTSPQPTSQRCPGANPFLPCLSAPTDCWDDVHAALSAATRFIYITGWDGAPACSRTQAHSHIWKP